jgi:hypothetical protein
MISASCNGDTPVTPDFVLLLVYRALVLIVAAAMVITILRSRDWRTQLFAAIVLIPFALRAAGVK